MSEEQCVMTHPPIPPKDGYTIYAGKKPRQHTMFNLRAKYECHFPASIDVSDPPDAWRPVLAAYYEVEWRKRAKRWAEVSRRVFVRQMMRRNGTTSHHRKTLAYQSERAARHVLIADENAAAWREWGEQK